MALYPEAMVGRVAGRCGQRAQDRGRENMGTEWEERSRIVGNDRFESPLPLPVQRRTGEVSRGDIFRQGA